MFAYFTYYHGSNPYIALSGERVMHMIRKYDLEAEGNNMFRVIGEKKIASGYAACKNDLYDFAVGAYTDMSSNYPQSYYDLAEWNDFFETYGKRFGLLRELRENGLC